jgi:hypothetical protein
VNAARMKNVLTRDLNAQDREWPSVSVEIDRDLITFTYAGGVRNGDLLTTPSIAVYRLNGAVANRVSPAALTRVGFIEQWLEMDLGRQ